MPDPVGQILYVCDTKHLEFVIISGVLTDGVCEGADIDAGLRSGVEDNGHLMGDTERRCMGFIYELTIAKRDKLFPC